MLPYSKEHKKVKHIKDENSRVLLVHQFKIDCKMCLEYRTVFVYVGWIGVG